MKTLLPSAASIFGVDKSLRNVQLQVLDARLHIEECEIFGTSDDLEDDEIEESEENVLSHGQIETLEGASAIQMMLPHIHHIHAVGLKLHDSNITNAARELCSYIVKLSDKV